MLYVNKVAEAALKKKVFLEFSRSVEFFYSMVPEFMCSIEDGNGHKRGKSKICEKKEKSISRRSARIGALYKSCFHSEEGEEKTKTCNDSGLYLRRRKLTLKVDEGPYLEGQEMQVRNSILLHAMQDMLSNVNVRKC